MSSILALSDTRRHFMYRSDTDMRKSFDGLCGIVRNQLGMSLMEGDLFIFLNRNRTHIKLLLWEHNGFSLFYRRLENGTFEVPVGNHDERSVQISAEQLLFMLRGIALKKLEQPIIYQQVRTNC